MGRSEYHGKRGGNAGDQYHELWALRRALELLQPSSRLQALSIEGVLAADEEGVEDAKWDGVDCACYYGVDPDTIDRVELVQLKYSGSASERPWTVARLCHADNKAKDNSVVARLSAAWSAMRAKRPSLKEGSGLAVSLVSNQPIADEVIRALQAPMNHAKHTKLFEASALTKTDFAKFSKSLDFSGCGSASRFAFEERVIVALSDLSDGDVRSDLDQLREFVRNRMRPEAKGENITAESIFSLFGHADSRSFLPNPSRLKQVDKLISRDVTERIIDHFLAGDAKVCVHGAGGEGKTTILQDLATKLPAHSVVVAYDCYGAGTYLDANALRHRPADAYLQIANECAGEMLLPPLLTDRRNPDPERRFFSKLIAAASVLATHSPEALMVIAVDAADNSVTAAAQSVPPETSFTYNFLRLGTLPPNVRLLVSARTGRLGDVDLPSTFKTVALGPFSQRESARYARQHFGKMSDEWCEEFHVLSGGNPRVQQYAIEFAGDDPERTLAYLNPDGKNLPGIFATRLAEAALRVGSDSDLKKFCAALIVLPRPIPIEHLAGAAAFSSAHGRDIVHDLMPGLRLSNDNVGFADEDFEQFVREEAESARVSVTVAAAKQLLANRATDAYACAHSAALALAAGRREDVLCLAREDPRTYPIEDPAERGEVHRRRLRAAMHVCRETGNPVDAASLLLQAADAMKTDEAVRQMLLNNLDLAAYFSRERIIALLLRDRAEQPKHGTLLMHLIGIDAASGNRISKNANERSFFAWIESRHRALQAKEDNWGINEEWPLKAEDAATMLMGLLELEGAQKGFDLLCRASPSRFRRDVFRSLAGALAKSGKLALLRDLYDSWPERHPGRILLAHYLGLAGENIDTEELLGSVETLASGKDIAAISVGPDYEPWNPRSNLIRYVLDSCDIAILKGADRSRVCAILDRVASQDSRSVEKLGGDSPRGGDLAARAYATSAALQSRQSTFDEFVMEPPSAKMEAAVGGAMKPSRRKALPSASKKDTPESRAEKLRQQKVKAKARLGPLLSFYEARARLLAGLDPAAEAGQRLADAVKKLTASRRELIHRFDVRGYDDRAAQSLLLIASLPKADQHSIFSAFTDLLGPLNALMRNDALTILRDVPRYPGLRSSLVDLIVDVSNVVSSRKMPADEKVEFLVGLSRTVLPVDLHAALFCFDAATEVAGEIDIDALYGIRVAAPLALRAQADGAHPGSISAAKRLAAIAQDASQRIGRADYFPWDQIAIALAALSPAVALASSARFEELELVGDCELLIPVLEEFARSNALSPEVLAAFVSILGSDGVQLAKILAADATGLLKEELARATLLEPLGEPEIFAPLFVSHKDHQSWSEALTATAKFLAEHKPDQKEHFTPQISRAKEMSCITEPLGISLDGIVDGATFAAHISACQESSRSYVSRRDVAEQLLGLVPSHRCDFFLDVLCDLPEDDYLTHDLTPWLGELLDRWAGRISAARWASQKLLKKVEGRLPLFLNHAEYRRPQLANLLKRSGHSDPEIATFMLASIERHADELSSIAVFQLIGVLGAFLSSGQAAEVLDQQLDRSLARLEPVDRALPGFDEIPLDVNEATARFLYADLGQILANRRWRAAHAVRRLGRLGETDLLSRLVRIYGLVTEPCFSHPQAPFYHLNARLWLMLAISRVAWEAPASVAHLQTWLFKQGESREFPHLLVRELAKSALKGLASHQVDPPFSDDELRRLSAINESPLPRRSESRPSWNRGFDRHRPLSDEGRRFRFDSMDTLPYWYTPFLRLFADPDEKDFLDLAERWIVERWGARGVIWEYDKIRGNGRFNRDRFDRSSHSHGGLPEIDRYGPHLEWHAMFCAGGEFIEVSPLTPEDDEDPWDQLPSWLARQGPTLAPLWLADLRCSKPLHQQWWWPPADTKLWLAGNTIQDVREELSLEDSEWLILSAYNSFIYGELSGSVRVESCLVTPATATALRLTLEASENSHQYRISIGSDDDIRSGAFGMKAILGDWSGDTELDIHDGAKAGVRAPSYLPLARFCNNLGVIRDPMGMPIWQDHDGVEILRHSAWSDPGLRDGDRSHFSASGSSLKIRRSALDRLLHQEGLDLLVNLTFRRRMGNAEIVKSQKDKRREREFDHIILFRRDGSVESTGGDLGSWKAD